MGEYLMDYLEKPTKEKEDKLDKVIMNLAIITSTEGMTAEALLKEYDEIKKIKDLKKFIPES
jgi:hypothetical protein